jgi:hypothetical protein
LQFECHQIDSADVFQDVVVEVDELLRVEVEHRLTVGGSSGADDSARQLLKMGGLPGVDLSAHDPATPNSSRDLVPIAPWLQR